MFSPQTQYLITPQEIPLEYFHKYKDAYVVRPPYQRKNVWSDATQKALLDSLFRQYYIPKIVLREVRLNDNTSRREVIDGQQRIITAQRFYNNELKLPNSLSDLDRSLPGKTFAELPVDIRQYVDTTLKYSADVINNISNPLNAKHQEIASEIFWRLQQGESLNIMEKAHARLSSISRNFIVQYSDDITFDFNAYKPVDSNPDKHPFFNIIKIKNKRMEHLSLMTRLLILEENQGSADLNNKNVIEYIEKYQQEDGVGNMEFSKKPFAKEVLKNLSALEDVFSDDTMLDEEEDEGNGSEIQEFKEECFIISVYLLLRHLCKYYIFAEKESKLFHNFVIDFHARWRAKKDNDTDIIQFSDNRRQSTSEIDVRDRIIRQIFFEYAKNNDMTILTKDDKRSFNESERILIYRRNHGLCQECLKEKPEKECRVSWSQYDADHVIPHSKGGMSNVDNAQLLCRHHNQKKGNRE